MSKKINTEILIGITGRKNIEWKEKLEEIEKNKISRVALFPQMFDKAERDKIYKALISSAIKEIPLVHLNESFSRDELDFLSKKFNTKYFTIHENHFDYLRRWEQYHNQLFLEFNTDDFVSEIVKVSEIGGFCVDLSHFKVQQVKQSAEFSYTMIRQYENIFKCNHINGYSYGKNTDLHTVSNLRDFDYLKTLPPFLFGQVAGIEVFNSIQEQLEFKEYLGEYLAKIL